MINSVIIDFLNINHNFMNIHTILEKLNKLDDVYRFVSLLEIKFLADKEFASSLKLAKKSLNKALINLVFDIQKKLETYNFKSDSKVKISSEIAIVFQQLQEFLNQKEICNNELLRNDLQDLMLFMKSYEAQNSLFLFTKDKEGLRNLKEKFSEIISERFA